MEGKERTDLFYKTILGAFNKKGIEPNQIQLNLFKRAAATYDVVLSMETSLRNANRKYGGFFIEGAKGNLKIHPYLALINPKKKILGDFYKTINEWLNQGQKEQIDIKKELNPLKEMRGN